MDNKLYDLLKKDKADSSPVQNGSEEVQTKPEASQQPMSLEEWKKLTPQERLRLSIMEDPRVPLEVRPKPEQPEEEPEENKEAPYTQVTVELKNGMLKSVPLHEAVELKKAGKLAN